MTGAVVSATSSVTGAVVSATSSVLGAVVSATSSVLGAVVSAIASLDAMSDGAVLRVGAVRCDGGNMRASASSGATAGS